MIKALFKTRNGVFGGFEISGHSGYAESGSDIVCASFSAMANLAVRFLEESGTEYIQSVDESKPALSVSVPEATCVSDIIIRSFYCEALEVSKEYPEYARVKTKAE